MPVASELLVRVAADTKDLESGLSRADKQVSGFAKSAGMLGSVATAGFVALGAAAVGLGVGIAKSVGAAMDFQQGIADVGALVNATTPQIQQLSDAALQLGQDTTLSGIGASDAAAAMKELASAGFSVDDMTGGVTRGVLLLASATGTDVAKAAEIAGSAFNQFRQSMGLTAADMPRISNLLVGTANASAVSVEDLGASLQYIGPVAASMGISLDQVTAALAELGNQGIKGSEAGTALRSILVSVTSPSKEAAKAISDLGLNFVDSTGHVKDFAGISEELKTKLSGLTDVQRANALSTIFGREALAAATVLYGDGAKGIQDYIAQIQAQGDAAAIGAQRNNTFRGALESLKGSAETAVIAFGTGLLPALQGLAQGLAGGVSAAIPFITMLGSKLGAALSTAIGYITTFGKVAIEIFKGIATGDFTNAFGPMLKAIEKVFGPDIAARMTLFVSGLLTLFQNFRNGIVSFAKGVSSGLGAVIEAISSFASGKTNFSQFIGGMEIFVKTVLGNLGKLASEAAPYLQAFVTAIGQFLASALPQIAAQLMIWGKAFGDWVTTTALPWLLPRLAALLTAIGTWITGTAVPAVVGFLVALGQAFGNWVTTTAIPFLQANLPVWLSALSGWITGTALPAITGFLLMVGQAFGNWVQTTAIPFLQANLPVWLAALSTWLSGTAIPAVVSFLTMIGQAFGNWVQTTAVPYMQTNLPIWLAALSTWITGTAVPAVAAFITPFAQMFGTWVTETAIPYLLENLPKWWLAAVEWFYGTVYPAAIELFVQLGKAFGDWVVNSAVPYLMEKLPEWWAAFVGWFYDTLIPGITAAFLDVADAFGDWVMNTAWPWLQGELGSLWDSFSGWISDRVSDITSGLESWASAFTDWATALPGKVVTAVGDLSKTLYQKGVDLVLGIIAGLIDKVQDLLSEAGTIAGKLPGAIGDVLKTLWQKGVDLVQGLIDGLISMVESAKTEAAAIPGKIKDGIGDLSGLLVSAGKALIQGLIDGIASKIGEAIQKVKDGVQQIRDLLPGSEPKDATSPLRGLGDAGAAIFGNLADGIKSGTPEAVKAAADAASSVAKAVTDVLGAMKALANFDFANDSPTGDDLGWFSHLTSSLIATMQDAASSFSEEALKAVSDFSDTVGKVGGSIKNAVEGLVLLGTTKWADVSPDGNAMGWFTFLVSSLVENFRQAAESFDADGLAEASTFAEAVGKVTGVIKTATEGLQSLRTFAAPAEAVVSRFMASLSDLMEKFGTWAGGFESDGLAQSTVYAEAVGKVTGVLKSATDGLAALLKFTPPAEATVSRFMTSLSDLMEKFGTWAGGFEADGLAQSSLFAEAVGKVTGSIDNAVKGLVALEDFSAPAESSVTTFMTALSDLMEKFGTWAGEFEADTLAASTVFAEAAGKVVAVVGPAAEGFGKLATLAVPSDAAISNLAAGIRAIVQKFADMASMLDSDGIKATGDFAAAANAALGAAKTGVELFAAMAGDKDKAGNNQPIGIPSATAIDQLMAGIRYVVAKFTQMASEMQNDGIKQMQTFAAAAGQVLAAAKSGTDLFKQMEKLAVPSEAAIDYLLGTIGLIISKIRLIAAGIGTDGLAEATAFATGSFNVISTLANGLKLFDELAKFKDIPAVKLEELWKALEGALDFAHQLFLRAEAIKAEAASFADSMKEAARLFAQGMSLGNGMGGGLPNPNDWVPGNFPALAAGGIVTRPTLAMIGEAGPEAVVPLSRYQRGGGGGGVTVQVTVEGNIYNADQMQDIIFQGLAAGVQRGRRIPA